MNSQSAQSKLTLDTLNISDFNQLLLLVRYRDSLPVINANEAKAIPFQNFCKMMLFDYGRTHSYQSFQSGLFNDNYTRETEKKSHKDPAKLFSYSFVEHPVLGYGLLVQDELVYKDIVNDLPGVSAYHQTTYLGRPTGFLAIKDKTKIEELRESLSDYGLFQTKEMLLASASNLSADQLHQRFDQLLSKSQHKGLSEEEVNTQLLSLYQPARNPKETIVNIFNERKRWQEDKRTSFYIAMLEKLFSSIKEAKLDDLLQQSQINASYHRLAFILTHALKRLHQKETFFALIEYAFDEITFLKMLGKPYSSQEAQTILKEFVQQSNALDESPQHTSLASSGMHAINNAVYAGFQTIKEQKEYSILVEKNSYFQASKILETLVPGLNISPFENYCYTSSGKKVEREVYKNQLIDMIICSFEQNPTFYQNSYGFNDIEKLIQKQLDLRNINSTKPLVVIIDTTASAMDDTRLSFLLLTHQEAIRSGKLAIITAHSLNKYFLMGFDKLPAGLNSLFFSEEAFPVLKAWKERPDYYGGFTLTDPTVQMISYCMKECAAEIHDYSHRVRGSARFVQERLVKPRDLLKLTKDSFLSIDMPYTGDVYKNCWGFLNIKMNNDRNRKAAKVVMDSLIEICDKIGISERDGYGYGYSTCLRIGQNESNEETAMLRINLGLESTQEFQDILNLLLDYLEMVEKIFRNDAAKRNLFKDNKIDVNEITDNIAIRFAEANKWWEKEFLVKIGDNTYRYNAPETIKHAIQTGNLDLLKKIIAKGYKFNLILSPENLSPLLYACSIPDNGGLAVLKLLHESGIPFVDNRKMTAGHVAAMYGNKECLAYCFQQGLAMTIKDSNDKSIFSSAIENGQLDLAIDLLETNHFSVSDKNIIAAAKNNHFNSVDWLLKRGPQLIVSKDELGNSLLHIAAQTNDIIILKLILSLQPDFINNTNKENLTPLKVAIKYKSFDAFLMLLKMETNQNTIQQLLFQYITESMTIQNSEIELSTLINTFSAFFDLKTNEAAIELLKLANNYDNHVLLSALINVNENNVSVISKLVPEKNLLLLIPLAKTKNLAEDLCKLISTETWQDLFSDTLGLINWTKNLNPVQFHILPLNVRQDILNNIVTYYIDNLDKQDRFGNHIYDHSSIKKIALLLKEDKEINQAQYSSLHLKRLKPLLKLIDKENLAEIKDHFVSLTNSFSSHFVNKISDELWNNFKELYVNFINDIFRHKALAILPLDLIKESLQTLAQDNELTNEILNSEINQIPVYVLCLRLAIKANDLNTIKFLCAKYPNLINMTEDKSYQTPLGYSIKTKNNELALFFIKLDKDGHTFDLSDEKRPYNNSPFTDVVIDNKIELCQRMLEIKPGNKINPVYGYGYYILAEPIIKQNQKMTDLLLESGMNLYATHNQSSLIQDVLIRSVRPASIEYLAKLIDPIKAKNILFDIAGSLQTQWIHQFIKLITFKPEILELKNVDNQTLQSILMHKALAEYNLSYNIVKLFIDKKIDITEMKLGNETIFDITIKFINVKVFELIHGFAKDKVQFISDFIKMIIATDDMVSIAQGLWSALYACQDIEIAKLIVDKFSPHEKIKLFDQYVNSSAMQAPVWLELIKDLTKDDKMMWLAIRENNPKLLDAIVKLEPKWIDQPDAKGNTPLEFAVKLGNLALVQTILKYKPNLVMSKSENYPLIYAIDHGQVEIAMELISYYNQSKTAGTLKTSEQNFINLVEDGGFTALILALERKHEDVALALLDSGADFTVQQDNKVEPSESNLYTALHLATEKVAKKIIELDKKGEAINKQDRNKATALMNFIEDDKSQELLQQMIQHPYINLAIINEDGNNALMIAVNKKNTFAIDKILKKEFDLFVKNNEGDSVFTLAIKNSDNETLQKLLVKAASLPMNTSIKSELQLLITYADQANNLNAKKQIEEFLHSKEIKTEMNQASDAILNKVMQFIENKKLTSSGLEELLKTTPSIFDQLTVLDKAYHAIGETKQELGSGMTNQSFLFKPLDNSELLKNKFIEILLLNTNNANLIDHAKKCDIASSIDNSKISDLFKSVQIKP